MPTLHVYILTNERRMLYIGVMRDLARRLAQHREKAFPRSYTAQHGIDPLAHLEAFPAPRRAAARKGVPAKLHRPARNRSAGPCRGVPRAPRCARPGAAVEGMEADEEAGVGECRQSGAAGSRRVARIEPC